MIIVADENIPEAATTFAPLGSVHTVNGRQLVASDLEGADVLLVRSVTRVDAKLLSGTRVRFVGTATSGTDHLDLDYLKRSGIGHAHAPGSNANSVVEYVLSAIAASDDCLEQVLAGAVVGIIGFGIIGKQMATVLAALGINYRVYDPWLVQAGIAHASTLERVLRADVITLHCSLTERRPWPSRHLLGSEQLATIRSDALLVNASRGPVIDNRALRNLLADGSGPQTVIDVWENEPGIDHALLRRVHCGTPHIAGYSLDAKLLATRMLWDAVLAFFDREGPAGSEEAQSRPPIRVSGELHGAELIRHLLQRQYDIRADDCALRNATLGLHPRIAAGGFDRLRRHYPVRRELRGTAVHGTGFDQTDINSLQALGCYELSQRELVL